MNPGRLSTPLRKKIGISALGALLVAAGVVLVGVSPVTAASGDPTFETPTGNPGTVGSVGFYDSTGTQIYGGKVSDDPVAAYFVASGGGIKTGDHVATAYTYAPQDNKPADQWTTPFQLTAGDESGTAADSAKYPGALKNSTKFIAVGIGGGLSINDSTGTFPLASTNDPGILQFRILTNGDSSHYYSTDIKITGSTWTQVFPAPPAAQPKTTSTTLSLTPNPSTVGQSVALSATETASDGSHPAGNVQFKDGAANLGSAVAVDANGTAAAASTALAQGSHSITAVFTPTASGFSASTSPATTQVVNPVPKATQTSVTLALSPTSPVTTPTVTTLSATITPANAAGTVQFLDGTANVGSAVTVSGGTAQATSTFAVGTHSLTARFTPTDSSAFAGSVSAAASYVVNPKPAQTTTTDLSVDPAGPVTAGDQVILTATVTPNTAPGGIQFYDGSTPIGMPAGNSTAGAQLITTSLSVGTHSLTAKFIPANAADFGSSTSAPVTLVVKAAPVATTTTVAITPSAKAVQGSSISYTASLAPTAAAGTVQFSVDNAAVGTPVTVSGGKASLPATATDLGTHTVTASFTPSDAAAFVASSGSATLTVIAPPTATTTTLTVTPASPVDFGTTVTLTASVPTTGAAGSVQFLDGTKVIDTVTLDGGSATTTTSTLASGSHSLTSTFVPADSEAFSTSSSDAATLVVNAQATTTVLSTTPDTLVSTGTSVSLTVALTPAGAIGSVQFLDGTTVLGSTAVKNGSATIATSALAVGDHSLTAVFTPTDAATYGSSTSTAVDLQVKQAATIGDTTVGGQPVTDGATLKPGDTVTISGSGFVPGESVKVLLVSSTQQATAKPAVQIVLDTVTADGQGAVTATVTIPSDLPAGHYSLVLQGAADHPGFAFVIAAATSTPTPTPSGSTSPVPSSTGSPISGSASASSGSGSGGGSSLASTGATVLPLAGIALVLLIGGAFLTVGSRRRRSH